MSLPAVVYTAPAADQLFELEQWWRANVPQDKNRVSEALAAGVELLQRHPLAGKAYRSKKVPDARRLLLTGLGYHLYYTYDSTLSQLLIVSVWNAKRKQPKLTR